MRYAHVPFVSSGVCQIEEMIFAGQGYMQCTPLCTEKPAPRCLAIDKISEWLPVDEATAMSEVEAWKASERDKAQAAHRYAADAARAAEAEAALRADSDALLTTDDDDIIIDFQVGTFREWRNETQCKLLQFLPKSVADNMVVDLRWRNNQLVGLRLSQYQHEHSAPYATVYISSISDALLKMGFRNARIR